MAEAAAAVQNGTVTTPVAVSTAAASPPSAAEIMKPAVTAESFQDRMKREAAKREVETLRAQLATAQTAAKETATLKARLDGLKANPDSLKEIFGANWYDYLTEHKIGGGRLTPEAVQAAVDAKFAEVETKRQAEKDTEAATAKKAEEEAEAEFTQEVSEFVAGDPKTYRLLNLHNSAPMVADYARKNYKATGKLASNAEAAAAVEGQLRKAVLDSLTDDLVAEWTKAKGQTTSASTASAAPGSTLHNGMAAGSGTPQIKLSREQRKADMLKRWDAEVGKG